jgi:hypothetical protein
MSESVFFLVYYHLMSPFYSGEIQLKCKVLMSFQHIICWRDLSLWLHMLMVLLDLLMWSWLAFTGIKRWGHAGEISRCCGRPPEDTAACQ